MKSPRSYLSILGISLRKNQLPLHSPSITPKLDVNRRKTLARDSSDITVWKRPRQSPMHVFSSPWVTSAATRLKKSRTAPEYKSLILLKTRSVPFQHQQRRFCNMDYFLFQLIYCNPSENSISQPTLKGFLKLIWLHALYMMEEWEK